MLLLIIGYSVFFCSSVLILNRRGITKRQDNILWMLMLLCLSLIAYLYDPTGTGLDVVRHFQRIEKIRSSDVPFGEFIVQNPFGYAGLYVFNTICYIIAKLNINMHVLPFLVTLVSYWISFYILRDWSRRESINRKYYALSLLVGFSFLPYYFVMCGIRNGVAMCIMALAVYLFVYRDKSIFVFVALAAIAATIHISTLLAVPFLLLSKLKFNYKSIGIVAITSLMVGQVAKMAAPLEIPYVSAMAKSYLAYSSEGQFLSAQYFLVTDIFLISLFSVLFLLQNRQYLGPKVNSKNTRLYNFIALYTAYIIGNFGNYDLVLRPAYLLGPLSPMLVYLVNNEGYWKDKRGIQIMIKAVVVCICSYTVLRYMAFFVSIVSFG